MKSIKSLSILSAVCIFLVGYQFMGATVWTSPTASPPNNNTVAPINIGGTTQIKSGNLQVNIFAASTEVRSDRYCDAFGGNCFNPDTVISPGTCPAGEFVTGFKATGNITCSTPSGGGPSNCVTETSSVRACQYDPNPINCPAGYSKTGPLIREGRCSTNNDYFRQYCVRTVCS